MRTGRSECARASERKRESGEERETERQTGRQADRQTERERERGERRDERGYLGFRVAPGFQVTRYSTVHSTGTVPVRITVWPFGLRKRQEKK
jgi:hypothetical protein